MLLNVFPASFGGGIYMRKWEENMTSKPISRRAALGGIATAGAASLAAPSLATAAGQTTTWKVQTSWPGGIGLQIF